MSAEFKTCASPSCSACQEIRRLRELLTAGICGDATSTTNGLTLGTVYHCTLRAGHAGWHENDQTPPMRWSLVDHQAAS